MIEWFCVFTVPSSAGQAEHAVVPATVPLWSVLLALEAQGAGVQEHRVDRRVHCTETQIKDRQWRQHRLNLITPFGSFLRDFFFQPKNHVFWLSSRVSRWIRVQMTWNCRGVGIEVSWTRILGFGMVFRPFLFLVRSCFWQWVCSPNNRPEIRSFTLARPCQSKIDMLKHTHA